MTRTKRIIRVDCLVCSKGGQGSGASLSAWLVRCFGSLPRPMSVASKGRACFAWVLMDCSDQTIHKAKVDFLTQSVFSQRSTLGKSDGSNRIGSMFTG